MSALAKLTMMTSKAVSVRALMTVSAMPGAGHFGGEVVGGDLLGGDDLAVFAREGLFDASVEEIGDVGELLGFGYAEVAEIRDCHDVGEQVVHGLGGDDDGELVGLVVLRHADVVDLCG